MAKSKTKPNRKTRRDGKLIPPKKAPKIVAKRTPASNSAHKRKTKADQILALMKRPGGATLNAVRAATGWQARSVRGFISGHLVKKMGLEVQSFRRDRERVYAISSKGSR